MAVHTRSGFVGKPIQSIHYYEAMVHTATTSHITIPNELLPSDGRFGSRPSKLRHTQIEQLYRSSTNLLGTSHRQPPVKRLVGSIREGLTTFFQLPDGYEVVLGNGGASAFWDIATAGLIEKRAAFGSYGSFSAKFVTSAASAPFLEAPVVYEGEPGSYRIPEFSEHVDAYAWAHNETSTGVAAPVERVPGSVEQHALTLIDATSGAGALPVNIAQTDAYYFSPQKAFGSEGGLWVAILSPDAIDRALRIDEAASSGYAAGSARWIPPFLSLASAIRNSRSDQTLNTPAIATLILLNNQLEWLNAHGGLAWSTERCARSAHTLYSWAERSDFACPFVVDPAARSNAVVTIDLAEHIASAQVVAALAANGIVDTFSYRKLQRNQLRIGVFPSVEPSDVQRLTQCIDYVVGHL